MLFRSIRVPGALAAVAAFAVILGVGWGTWWAIGRTLAPVARIRRQMTEITTSGLSRRVSVADTEEELTELTENINTTLERLKQAVDNQRRFAADASHELRTPLTGLRTKLELALADPEGEDLIEAIRSALRDAERLQAIVSDLLLLARLDAEVEERSETIDLTELVDEEVRRLPSRRSVLTHLDPGVTVRGNRGQLRRLLTNLLTNAERYAATTVSIRTGAEGGSAVLEVSDDGPGIPPGERERIFQRFARLDTARDRRTGGTGLGLPIARDIACAHRGSLCVADALDGRGARLVLRLPLARDLAE